MRMPAFSAEASLYKTSKQDHMMRAERASEQNSVQPAQSAVSFIDPNCGPCTCRIVNTGIGRWFFCIRDCKELVGVTPLNEGIYRNYTRSCSPPWWRW